MGMFLLLLLPVILHHLRVYWREALSGEKDVPFSTSKGKLAMNKRPGALEYVFGIGFPVMGMALLIALFYFQAYKFVFIGFALLLIGVGMLYTGIKQVREAKRRGAPVPWWKHHQVIFALFFVCVGGMFLTSSLLNHVQFSDILKNIFVILFVLLTLGLGIYGLILGLQYIETNKRLGDRKKTGGRSQL
ncbi:MAG TPA: hypothetical protein VIY29_06900 [Ktedonobacteraceae bacterium]